MDLNETVTAVRKLARPSVKKWIHMTILEQGSSIFDSPTKPTPEQIRELSEKAINKLTIDFKALAVESLFELSELVRVMKEEKYGKKVVN